MAAEETIPGFQPRGQIRQNPLRLLVIALLLGEWLEQRGCACGQEQFLKVHILTSVYLTADPRWHWGSAGNC